MTKDVLVSISGHHIDIMAEPEETPEAMESGRDAIEVVTPASYYCKGGKHYIIYDEVLEGMAGTIKNRIKITGTDSVEIVKSGLSSSHMIFEKNRKNLTYYRTPYGQMLVGVNTRNMEVSVEDDRINVTELHNYSSKDGITYFSDVQVDKLQDSYKKWYEKMLKIAQNSPETSNYTIVEKNNLICLKDKNGYIFKPAMLVETVSEDGGKDILPFAEQRRHIVHRIEIAAVVVRVAGVEAVIGDGLTVQGEFAVGRSRGVEPGADNPLLHREGAAEHRSRDAIAAAGVRDPAGLPFGGVEQGGLERRDGRDEALPGLVPGLHAPPIGGPGLQRPVGRHHDQRAFRHDLPRIPNIGIIEFSGFRRHTKAAGGLHELLSARIGPRKARRRGIDAKG